MRMPPADIESLLGEMVVGADPYGKFRGSDCNDIFLKAGWRVTEYCPRTGWEEWAADQVREFLLSDGNAIRRLLSAMADTSEFLDRTNRIQQRERKNQVERWNGFLAPFGLQIHLTGAGVRIEDTSPGYLSSEEPHVAAGVPEEVAPLVRKLHDQFGPRAVFLMFQFNTGVFTQQLVQNMKRALLARGYTGVCATDRKFTEVLWRNIQAYLHGCCAGVAIFDRLESDQYNANVALEAGYMIGLAKPVGFLKERTVRGLQSDLAGHIWYPFDLQVPQTIDDAIDRWLREDGLIG